MTQENSDRYANCPPVARLPQEAASYPWELQIRGDATQIPLSPDGRRRVLFHARTSMFGGAKAIRAVHKDLLNATADFEKRYGADLSHAVPSLSQVTALFKAAPRIKAVERNGSPFYLKFVEIDLRARHGVYLLLVMGSGSKLDHELKQPAMERLTEVVSRIQPGAVFAKHIFRMGRHPWAFGTIVTELMLIGGMLGDAESGLKVMESMSSLLLFFKAIEGANEAKQIGPRTRKGMRTDVHGAMVDGVAYVGAPCPLPPGLARIRLRHRSGKGPSVLVLESPEFLPDRNAVAYGYPETGVDGSPVDQVSNVRWALERLGTMDLIGIGEGLIERRFSTTGLRQLNDPRAVNTNPETAIRSIVDHLEFYRTGVLSVRLGAGFDDMQVNRCLPPGGWATPERFAEIDEWLEQRHDRLRRRSLSTFGGLRVRVNGRPAFLKTYKKGSWEEGDLRYRTEREDFEDEATWVGAVVSHRFLAGAVVNAIAAAGTQAHALIPPRAPVSQRIAQQRAALQQRRASLEANLASIAGQLAERDSSGALRITGALLSSMNADYNAVTADLDEANLELEHLDALQAADEAAHRQRHAPALTNELLQMVESLRDPLNLVYQDRWRKALTDIELTVTKQTRCGLTGTQLQMSAFLRAGDTNGEIRIPVVASRDLLEDEIIERVQRIEADLRNGIPLRHSTVPLARHMKSEVGAHLGIDPGRFGVSQCDDPRILRVAMARCHPVQGPVTDDEVAEQLDEPVELVATVREIWMEDQPAQWRLPGAPAIVALFLSAAAHDGVARSSDVIGPFTQSHDGLTNSLKRRSIRHLWTYKKGRSEWTLEPCPRCGSIAQAPCLIREVTDVVCLGCWHDRRGVEWPPEPYGHLIDGLDAWQRLGLIPVLGPNPFGDRHAPRRHQRRQSSRRRSRTNG